MPYPRLPRWLASSIVAAILFVLARAASADGAAIVVYGCAVADDGTASGGLDRRLTTALNAATSDPKAPIVVTGGAVANRFAEAHVMRDWLVQRGVDPKRIVVEDRARFTRENAMLAVPILQRLGATRVTVVTERFHVRRSVVDMKDALRAAGVRGVGVTSVAAPDRLTAAERVIKNREEAEKVMRDHAMWTFASRRAPVATQAPAPATAAAAGATPSTSPAPTATTPVTQGTPATAVAAVAPVAPTAP